MMDMYAQNARAIIFRVGIHVEPAASKLMEHQKTV